MILPAPLGRLPIGLTTGGGDDSKYSVWVDTIVS
jgi:hypothetical protein